MDDTENETQTGFSFDFVHQQPEPTDLLPSGDGPGHPPTILLHGPEMLPTRLHHLTG
ncbi:hypothetical protein [Streptomyces sp. 35G-GA-8]|uniref:hypothetical protein n=1 Tax=Streptomyces sp. 35G-GA-8 TaxID=2939434 RepID=UPI00201F303F|nr:hypothetical protein [Streptomyces sp. 35G-GA-8]MCL7382197.1 hypothetical protein [Streptomyces sp. 35G-GA-8]